MTTVSSATDVDLEQVLVGRLAEHRQLRIAGLRVRVRRGLACMKGAVANVRQRRLASEVAAQVEGVLGVVNMLEVMEYRLPEDDRLRHRVAAALAANGRVNDGGISVRAADGVVLLTGSADTVGEKWLAECEARETRGVKHVTDRITVTPPVRPRTDVQTVGEILQTFSQCLGLDLSRVAVDIHGGVVHLMGAVPDVHTRSTAEQLARWTPHVVDVVNELAVHYE